VADFCLIPFGTSDNASVAPYIAECQRILAKSGLTYTMHGYGTGLEGEWDDVSRVIKECHERIHELGVIRIATDIRIGTRTDKKGSNAGKVKAVEDILAKDP